MSGWFQANNLPTEIKGLGRWFKRASLIVNYWIRSFSQTNVGSNIGSLANFQKTYNGATYLGGGFLGSGSFFLTKITSSGAIEWQKNSPNLIEPGDIVVTNSSIFLDAGGSSVAGSILNRLNLSGALQWSKVPTLSTATTGGKIKADSVGNCVWSTTDGTLIYLMKISLTGAIVWQFQGGTSIAASIAVDGIDNIYAVQGSTNQQIVKLNSAGTFVYAKQITVTFIASCSDVNANNDLIVIGSDVFNKAKIIVLLSSGASALNYSWNYMTGGFSSLFVAAAAAGHIFFAFANSFGTQSIFGKISTGGVQLWQNSIDAQIKSFAYDNTTDALSMTVFGSNVVSSFKIPGTGTKLGTFSVVEPVSLLPGTFTIAVSSISMSTAAEAITNIANPYSGSATTLDNTGYTLTTATENSTFVTI